MLERLRSSAKAAAGRGDAGRVLQDVEVGLPVEVEETSPLAYGTQQIQGLIRYDRTDDGPEGNDLLYLEPRLLFSLGRNAEAGVGVSYVVGSASDAERGSVDLEALYNFNQGLGFVPAIALEGSLQIPFGEQGENVETELKALASWSLGSEESSPKVYLNLSWLHLFDREPNQRGDRYRAAVGYGHPVSDDLMLVADVMREQEEDEDEDINLVEAGVRYRLTQQWVLSAGAGLDIGDESPDGSSKRTTIAGNSPITSSSHQYGRRRWHLIAGGIAHLMSANGPGRLPPLPRPAIGLLWRLYRARAGDSAEEHSAAERVRPPCSEPKECESQ
jgi:hypothetical protein